jgi:hypothetical protein
VYALADISIEELAEDTGALLIATLWDDWWIADSPHPTNEPTITQSAA